MRIRAIHTFEYGVLGTQSIDFNDDWDGETASQILLSGPNGCGKSTLLSSVALLWKDFGFWLQHRAPNLNSPFVHGGIALIIEQLPFGAPNIILYMINHKDPDFGLFPHEWVPSLKEIYPEFALVGQLGSYWLDMPRRELDLPESTEWFDNWTHARQKMLISSDPSLTPNILFLDAEERRWVTPKQGLGEIRSENLQQRWLSSYQATTNWDGQVESALLNMKISSEERFINLVDDMNRFLSGKKIIKKVNIGENRLLVQLDNGNTHKIDELSAGERQVLILLYMVERWLEEGGIALIDEPDLYLHPSLISGFLSQLERMVAERSGQLIITSHIPEVWERYEALGQRISLGADA